MPRSHPRRPLQLRPHHLNKAAEATDRAQAAHLTAQAVVNYGRGGDPQVVAALVALGDRAEMMDDIAAIWADSAPDTLPGALWRLYALRRWIGTEPRLLADTYAIGSARAEVADAVAGVEQPPDPQAVAVLADAVLAGAVSADLDVALDRAAAFCAVVSTGTALAADDETGSAAVDLIDQATRLRQTAQDLTRAARLARAGRLR